MRPTIRFLLLSFPKRVRGILFLLAKKLAFAEGTVWMVSGIGSMFVRPEFRRNSWFYVAARSGYFASVALLLWRLHPGYISEALPLRSVSIAARSASANIIHLSPNVVFNLGIGSVPVTVATTTPAAEHLFAGRPRRRPVIFGGPVP
jgi:hypothetical protein